MKTFAFDNDSRLTKITTDPAHLTLFIKDNNVTEGITEQLMDALKQRGYAPTLTSIDNSQEIYNGNLEGSITHTAEVEFPIAGSHDIRRILKSLGQIKVFINPLGEAADMWRDQVPFLYEEETTAAIAALCPAPARKKQEKEPKRLI